MKRLLSRKGSEVLPFLNVYDNLTIGLRPEPKWITLRVEACLR